MRQIWISKAGPPETLLLKEAADPNPQAGEARIRVEASGVNFADVMGRMGLYPDLPKIPVVPGYEVAGRVDSVGEGVYPVWIGRNVFALTRFGGYADVVCAPTGRIFARPEGMSAEQGAAIPVNYITAWQLVVVMGGLKAGETMLVHSAGGGVGVAATQIAKHAPPPSTRNCALGVDHLSTTGPRTSRSARKRSPRAGSNSSSMRWAASRSRGLQLLAPTGRLGMFGASSAARSKTGGMLGMVSMLAGMPWLQFNPLSLMNANKGVFGVNLGHMWDEGSRVAGWVNELVGLWEQGAIKPRIARTFTFGEAAAAHHFIQDRSNLGKVLLIP